MALADFSQLQTLQLVDTAVTVDIQDIGSCDFSNMEELFLGRNQSVTGNTRSLRVLKDTLHKLTLEDCRNVEGNFMDLADFSQLTSLHLVDTAVTVDTQDISNGDFSRLKDVSCVSGRASGKIGNLWVLKDTLEYVKITYS